MQIESIEGIVLQKINYAEHAVIIKLLTETDGVRSFIFPGGKSKNKQGNLLNPLAIVQVEFTKKPNQDLGSIREIHAAVVFRDIPFNPYKSGILFFINEVLNNTVKEQEESEGLYQFLRNALQVLDLADSIKNFPAVFLIQLTHYLGFYPKVNEGGVYFDLQEGTFVSYRPAHAMYVSQETSGFILSLLNAKLDGSNQPHIPLQMRRKVLHELINYYRVLFDHFKDLHSLPILEETFHD